MNEREKRVIRGIMSVLSQNKCTVAEAKRLLRFTKKAILEKTTVQPVDSVDYATQQIMDRPLPEILERLGLPRNGKPEASQEN